MQPGYICVAGIDLDTLAHIRPVMSGARRLSVVLLTRDGGPFDIGKIVELGSVRDRGSAPEVEDRLFDPARAASGGEMAPDMFWSLLESLAKPTLQDIFGEALEKQARTFAVPVDTGTASLGCLVPSKDLGIRVDAYDKVRLWMTMDQLPVNLPVTDLRLYEQDHKTPRRNRVNTLSRRIRSGVGVLLSVGLTRAWQRPGDTVRRHWLQVNNIHLADDPTWQVG